jgi:radical S-adenosyl methionine domain-containing protein 2
MYAISGPPVEAVNFHLWQPCNMHCGFCFASFKDVRRDVLPDGHLSEEDATEVVRMLAKAGFGKITFAGGEPLLCPWLPVLIREAKYGGMATNVVTNGALLDEKFLGSASKCLDWVTLSVDSVSRSRLIDIGRSVAGTPMDERRYRSLALLVKAQGIQLKINTVVNRANRDDDLSSFILDVRPRRWKILQALPVRGQNDRLIDVLAVTKDEFLSYVRRHRHVADADLVVVPEDNEAMTGTYAMLDPAGRFIDNVDGTYRYSDPILSHGPSAALNQVRISRQGFLKRGGKYIW